MIIARLKYKLAAEGVPNSAFDVGRNDVRRSIVSLSQQHWVPPPYQAKQIPPCLGAR